MKTQLFSLKEAAEITQTEWLRVRQWVRLGFVVPHEKHNRRGVSNRFDLNDLIKIEALKVLSRLSLLSTAAPGIIAEKDFSQYEIWFYLIPHGETGWRSVLSVSQHDPHIAIPVGSYRSALRDRIRGMTK